MSAAGALPTTQRENTNNSGNTRIAIICISVVLAMLGAAYAAVPLYALFCQVTGFAGTTQISAGNVNGIIQREMAVRFDSNISADLNWSVQPASTVTDQIGVVQTITYLATNNSNHEVTATAMFNVAPDIAGAFFNKIECFCFTEQTLAPGETVEMPVTFFLDPELDAVAELDTVRQITLSYTFFNVDQTNAANGSS